MNTAADLVERAVRETLTYYAFPDIQCLHLAAARLRYITSTAWSTERYMNMPRLNQPHVMQTGAIA